MNVVRRICLLLVGFVFFLAGFLKLMDPVGTSLIVGEYFKFLHLGFLDFSSGFTGICLALVESLLGAALITGVWKKITAIISAVLLFFFTLVTLALFIFNPSMDCGCFGEAIHLTHLQSLLKNIVLLALLVIGAVPFSRLTEPKRVKYVSFSIAAISLALFAVYSIFSIPALDFTPMAPGTELMDMSAPFESDTVRTRIYVKDGREGAFTESCLPDSSWTFVRDASFDDSLEPDGRDAQIFSFHNLAGEYCDSLAVRGKVMLVTVYKPSSLSSNAWSRISDFVSEVSGKGYSPIVVVAGTPEMLEGSISDTVLPGCVYFGDRRSLMTINRSNGGATYINDGEIVRKWSASSRPHSTALDNIEKDSRGRLRVQGVLLYVFAVMLLL